MIATVHNRRGFVVAVDVGAGRPEGRLHLVRVEYTDGDGAQEDTILWERERPRALLEPTAVPHVDAEQPMPTDRFDVLVHATRWSGFLPFARPDVWRLAS